MNGRVKHNTVLITKAAVMTRLDDIDKQMDEIGEFFHIEEIDGKQAFQYRMLQNTYNALHKQYKSM